MEFRTLAIAYWPKKHFLGKLADAKLFQNSCHCAFSIKVRFDPAAGRTEECSAQGRWQQWTKMEADINRKGDGTLLCGEKTFKVLDCKATKSSKHCSTKRSYLIFVISFVNTDIKIKIFYTHNAQLIVKNGIPNVNMFNRPIYNHLQSRQIYTRRRKKNYSDAVYGIFEEYKVYQSWKGRNLSQILQLCKVYKV